MREGFIYDLAYLFGMTIGKICDLSYLLIIVNFVIFLATYELADYISNRCRIHDNNEGVKK